MRMRVEPYSVGSILHVVKRGARGMQITRDTNDQQRFVSLLFYLNDEFKSDYWEDEIALLASFERPDHWPERKPLVDLLSYTLMPNHFHLLIKEIREGGTAKFMQRLGGSMSTYHNLKYQETGSIFQGSYKSRTVDTDAYLRYVAAYGMTKNVFELYPRGGLVGAHKNFEDAWQWALTYPYSSFASLAGKSDSPDSGESDFPVLAQENLLYEMFPTSDSFKTSSRDMISAYIQKHADEYIGRGFE